MLSQSQPKSEPLLYQIPLSPTMLRQDWTAETSFAIYPMFAAILQYTVETLLLDANVLRDSILVRMELIHFECYIHANAIMWRLVYRELRAVTNDRYLTLTLTLIFALFTISNSSSMRPKPPSPKP